MESSLLEYFIALVKIASESKAEGSLARKIAADLTTLGARVEFDQAHQQTGGDTGNLYAFFPSANDSEPLLLSAHMDTVVPGCHVQPRISGDLIKSDGTTILGSDDKSGIAQIIWAIKELQDAEFPCGPLEILFTISEEIGLLGAKFCDYSRLQSRLGFALDTHHIGELMIGAPSQNNLKFVIHGRESHAGVAPEDGLNAIKIAAAALVNLPSGRIDDETTCNLGIINGGKATNIVPNQVFIEAEARSHNHQKLHDLCQKMKHIMESTVALHKLPDFTASVEVEITESYQAFRLPLDSAVVKLGLAANREMGINIEPAVGGGGSDANIFNQHGISMAVVGTGMNKVHTLQEEIRISDLESGKNWVKEVIKIHSGKALS